MPDNQLIYNILLPIAFDTGFDYRVPEGLALQIGDYVWVPFGRKTVLGVVWGAAQGGIDSLKIKDIQSVAAHVPPMPAVMRSFIDWVAWYTMSPKGNVLKMALFEDALRAPRQEQHYCIAKGEIAIKRTPARTRVLAYLSDGLARSAEEIATHAKTSKAVLRDMVKQGVVQEAPASLAARTETLAPCEGNIPVPEMPALSVEQTEALARLELIFTPPSSFKAALLDGVTGSGKTEVYFSLILKQIRVGKQVLVMLPEIGLSVQWLERFKARFGFAPALWHSGVTPAKKRETWIQVANGEAKVVVGARSSLFLPFRNLSLIVVDEEHDHSYKQEEGVLYQARDMAVVRASKEKIPVLLVSATPSLETVANVEQKKYGVVHMHGRFAGAVMPAIKAIDMRQEKLPSGTFLSAHLKTQMAAALDAGGQVMLFMNRRGYAPLVLCKACGHRFCCPNCDTWLVMHKKKTQVQALHCHHCGYHVNPPEKCPSCDLPDTLFAFGPGVERIEEEVAATFPQAKIGALTSDLVESPKAFAKLISDMETGVINILIGTQMVAKGHHFANLTLVGVIDADMGMTGGDLRAGERTYQLLHQLSGRAGREKKRGSVLLQSYMPEHPVMQALVRAERDLFMQLESDMRKEADMPPFGRLAAIIIEGNNEQTVHSVARELARTAPNPNAGFNPRKRSDPRGSEGGTVLSETGKASSGEAFPPLQILGPTPAPFARLRGRTRYRFLIKAARVTPLQQILSDWIYSHKIPSGVRVKIDIDPYSFL